MEKYTNGNRKISVDVYSDEGSRHFHREFKNWFEAEQFAEMEVNSGAYKADVYNPEVLTFTNDKNYLSKLRGKYNGQR